MALEKCDTCGGIHFRNAPCPPALLAKKIGAKSAVTLEHSKPAPRVRGPEKFPAQDKRHPEGETRTKPKPVGQAVSPANPEAKATKGKAGPASRAKPDSVASGAALKRKDTRKGDRHKAGYWSTYQRKDRMK